MFWKPLTCQPHSRSGTENNVLVLSVGDKIIQTHTEREGFVVWSWTTNDLSTALWTHHLRIMLCRRPLKILSVERRQSKRCFHPRRPLRVRLNAIKILRSSSNNRMRARLAFGLELLLNKMQTIWIHWRTLRNSSRGQYFPALDLQS